ncbi:hypothetical protein HU200_028619 [Digitaria exilis]|uniref:Uncharacterized protein n=1 Tax=Digitaria exilis TaxID=1010633 RepID=A0A835C3G6_9POAL|nr:hypothetical protein HU200_028619 [Digitaria exilis]
MARWCVELSIGMPGAPPAPAASDTAAPAAAAVDGADAADNSSSEPEKNLNYFVRVLATGELVGNALGTLASLWATFVLLGGYRSSLKHLDFWIATAMVFLEAFRVFIRNFKLDSQSLFGSSKAFKEIRSSLALLLFRPQESDSIVLIIVSVVLLYFRPQRIGTLINGPKGQCLLFGLLGAYTLEIVLIAMPLIGNLQIPATVAQVILSSWRLANSYGDNKNMVASIRVFYALVLCQGLLYILACTLALFSVFPRRSLARRLGFEGEWGARAVDLYYERAYTKRIEIGVFAEDTISLASFVVDSLNSASSISRELHFSASKARELQLAGVRVLHSLLQQKGSSNSNEELISVITRSEKAVPTLISMLDWTFKQDRDIRLFAAKATADLAGYLRIARVAGAVKSVSSLLDAAENQPPSENDERPPQPAESNQRWWSWVYKSWQRMEANFLRYMEMKSINSPQDYSVLPVLGMKILERLACDPDNCAEIMKNTNLISKIIGLISYTSNDGSSNDNALIIISSLNFVRMIATTNEKVGATIWQDLWESPLLLSNLTCVLQDCRSSLEVWKPAIDIIATLALDEVARHELGRVQVIIHNLLHIFIIEQDGPTNYDQLLRVAAGAALANLAMETPENCLAMLEERQTFAECSRIKEPVSDPEVSNQLSAALRVTFDECSRIKGWLSDTGVRTQLSSALRLVLQNIMAAENKQLEALIGLASQICYVLPPRRFVQGLESHVIEPTIVQKLVNTLNSNKKPSHEYPRMRRAIVDMVISVLRHSPSDAIIFRTEGGMVDALSKVETTPSKVEKYRVFLSKEGVVLEQGLPLRDLVATAKGLIHHAAPT